MSCAHPEVGGRRHGEGHRHRTRGGAVRADGDGEVLRVRGYITGIEEANTELDTRKRKMYRQYFGQDTCTSNGNLCSSKREKNSPSTRLMSCRSLPATVTW